jgi:predicted amidohydrolase YtcJ
LYPVAAAEILKTKVLETFVAGQQVYAGGMRIQ